MKKNENIKSVLLYDIILFIFATAFTMLVPSFLNYPPNSYNTEFETTIDAGLYYNVQAFAVILVGFVISNIYFIISFKSLEKYKKYIGKDDEESKQQIEEIKKNCFKMPPKVYIVNAIVPSLSIILILLLTGAGAGLAFRIGLLLFAFFLLHGIIAFIFAKNISNKILQTLGNQERFVGRLRYTFTEKIFLLFFPLILATIIFSTLAGGAVLESEVGENTFKNYQSRFALIDNMVSYDSLDEIINQMNKVEKINSEDVFFVIKPLNTRVGDSSLRQRVKESILYIDDQSETGVDEFFIKYTFNVSTNGHTYGYYASGKQGVFLNTSLKGVPIAYGVLYRIDTGVSFSILTRTSIIMFLISVFFLFYFSKDIGNQVFELSDNMSKVANEKNVDYDNKMTVISNDELGDLVVSFNKILDMEKAHNEQMVKNQEILIEQERLSSLGQLIGGIAHNLKTPIMSISGASKALDDLINEYDKSIGNDQVNEKDFHEIANDMHEWNNKINVYLDYMTEIINTAKGQAVSMNASMVTEFSIKELVTRIQILMKEQLMQFNCELNLENSVNDDITIKGEISAIIQVLNNLINNAIEAYNKTPGIINLRIFDNKNNVFIEVEDYAGGIPEHIKDKLFRQMITTKGKDGPGLGLYICYSTIKGKFNGDLSFVSEKGKGTTFKIVLNKNI